MFTIETLTEYATQGKVVLKRLSDLEMDIEALGSWQLKGANQFLWLVKESGTILLPLRKAVDPVFCHAAYYVSCQAFLIDLGEETIEAVTREKAVELISQFPFSLDAYPPKMLETKVRGLLKQRYITDSVLRKAELDPEKDNLPTWRDYFGRIENKLMFELLSQACEKLQLVRC